MCRSWLRKMRGFTPQPKDSISHFPVVVPENPSPVFSEEAVAFLWDLFETYVDPILKHIREHCSESIPSVDMCLVTGLTRLLQVGCLGVTV